MKAFFIQLAALLFFASGMFAQVNISQATVGNVDVSQFHVFWQVDGGGVPRLDIFSDAGGTTSLNGQLGVEFYPLEMNDVTVTQTAEQRADRRALQALTQSKGIILAKVTGAQPGTTYHVRPRSFSVGGAPNEAALAPLLPVTTAQKTAFVVESRQLRVSFGGCFAGSQGLVMKLSMAGAPYPLLSVVGDFDLDEQALFDLSRLLNPAGTTNAALAGTPQFTLELIGPTAPVGTNLTDVPYNSTHVVAQLTDSIFLVNFPGLAYFSLDAVTTPVQGIPFVFNITARASNGTVLTSYNSNVDLSSSGVGDLFEGAGETPAFSNGVLAGYQVIPAVSGDVTLTVIRPCGIETGSQLFNFSALTLTSWRGRYFGANAGNESMAGFEVDFDKDGFPNGLEYYFGMDPTVFEASPMQEPDLDGSDFVFDYWRSRLTPGITARPIWSETLETWRTDIVSQQVVETVGAFQRVRVRVPAAGLTKVFASVEVTQ